jgi:hypothetical protein
MEVSDLLYYGIRNDIVLDIDRLRTYSHYRELIKPIVINLFGKVITNTNDLYEAYKKSPSVFMVLLHAILKTHGKKELMPIREISFQIPDDYEVMMVDNMTEAIKPLCYDNIYIIQNNTTAGLITTKFTLPYTGNINKDALSILRRKYHIDISTQEVINVHSVKLFISTLQLLEQIQDGLREADSNTLEFSIINLFIPFIFSDVVLNGLEVVKIKAHTKVRDAFSETLLYDWLDKRHDVYDELITKLYVLLLRKPMEVINGLKCVSNCLRCVRVTLMGTLS